MTEYFFYSGNDFHSRVCKNEGSYRDEITKSSGCRFDDPNQVIWDARSAEEYRGLKQASRHLGHIPGAVNLDWLDVQDPAQNFRIIDHLTELLTQKGISDKKGIITHCQTHHRSGLTYMLGRLLGLPIRAYHGSWSEWGNRDDVPIERES